MFNCILNEWLDNNINLEDTVKLAEYCDVFIKNGIDDLSTVSVITGFIKRYGHNENNTSNKKINTKPEQK